MEDQGTGDTHPGIDHDAAADRGKVSWSTMLAALRVPAFAWYWSGQLLSGIGTWSQSIALSWLVLDLTHSAVDLGTVTMLQFLPILVFALFGGVIADRLPRRQLLFVTQIALAAEAVALGLLVATHIVTLWEVGVISFLVGTTNALNNPAQQAFVPDLVGLDLVADAVALNSVQVNTARMLGGAVGGLAIAVSGIAGALFLNAVSFVPIVIVLWVIRPVSIVGHPKETHGSALAEVRQGLSYALATTSIRRVVVLFVIIGFFGFNWQVAVPLVARFVLHRHATGFGDLMAALGAGSLVAAVAATRDQRASEGRLIIGGIALGATLVALGLSHSYPISLIVLGFAGFAGVVASITANTRLQILTPDRMRGRVMGIYILLMGGTTPIGSFLLGELADRFGTGTALVIFGVVTVGGIGIVATLRRGARSGKLGALP
ncbi:MAG: MFS transporter [Actinomycetota bacterium]|nr:MFS transporter [Actinomycetota bacterium]